MTLRHLLASAVAGALLVVAPGAFATERYQVDPTHTFPSFQVNHLGLSLFSGRFDRTEGHVEFDRKSGRGKVDITIHADSVSSGVAKLDEHLRAEDFFDVARHPTIRFQGDRLHFEGDRLTAVDGQLTLLGVTRPLRLDVTHFACREHPMLRVPACGANAEGRIKRSEFGMDAYMGAVSDEVRLMVSIEGVQAAR